MVRLLVVRNCAGALTPIVEWMNNHGHPARIIESLANDPYQMTATKNVAKYARITPDRRGVFYAMYEELRTFQPTIIHVSSSHHALAMARFFAPFTPIVFEYHGSEVRNRCVYHGLPEYWETGLADKKIVSTPDLKRFGEWFDRPIPLNFKYTGGRTLGTALMYYADFFEKDQRKFAKDVADHRGLELIIINRSSSDFIPIPNDDMPAFYSQFEYYFDFKGNISMSKSALEALSCGCKIVHDDDPYGTALTYEADFERLTWNSDPQKYLKMYKSLEKPRLLTALKRLPRLVASTHKRLLRCLLIVLKYYRRKRRNLIGKDIGFNRIL